jgi:holo-[acyl-carrier protein] synthase
MIRGIGTELIDLDQVSETTASGVLHLADIFTDAEIEYCESKARKAQHYAARLAAKGAIRKAFGHAGHDGLAFREIEIKSDEGGEPRVVPHGRVKELFESHQIKQACISLSHTKHCAVALIILEG